MGMKWRQKSPYSFGSMEDEFHLEPIDTKEPNPYTKDWDKADTTKDLREKRIEKYSPSVQETIKNLDGDFEGFMKHLQTKMSGYISGLSPTERRDVLQILGEFYPFEIRNMWKSRIRDFDVKDRAIKTGNIVSRDDGDINDMSWENVESGKFYRRQQEGSGSSPEMEWEPMEWEPRVYKEK